jgi:hypothetical protein
MRIWYARGKAVIISEMKKKPTSTRYLRTVKSLVLVRGGVLFVVVEASRDPQEQLCISLVVILSNWLLDACIYYLPTLHLFNNNI